MAKKELVPQKKFSAMISTDGYRIMIENTLRDPERQKRFVAAITSAVAATPALQSCEPSSILAAALLSEGLNLPPSPQLGYCYLVPFTVKAKDRNGKAILNEKGEELYENRAQFVLGYKGYIQLAMRSGQYKRLNVCELKRGEIEDFDPIEEELIGRKTLSYTEREAAPTIGYMAYFEYLNGFRKTIYWPKEKMMAHADKYSPAFSAKVLRKIENGEISDRDMWKYSSFWYKDFDSMAKKTMLRQLISKWGVMTTDMQTAFMQDEHFASAEPNGSEPSVVEMEIQAPTEIPALEEPLQTEQPVKANQQSAVRQVSLNDL